MSKKQESKHKFGQPESIGGYMAGMVSDKPGEPRMDDVNNIKGIPEEDKYAVAQKLELLEQKEVGIIEDLYNRHFKETRETLV